MYEQQPQGYAPQGAYPQQDSLHLRLSFDDVTDRFYRYISGKEQVIKKNAEGEEYIEYVQVSEARANEQGIRALMEWLETGLNTHSVQGNTNDERFGYIMSEYLWSAAWDITINRAKYGVKKENVLGIIDKMFLLTYMVSTRTLDNEERKSLVPTVRHVETSTQNINEPKKSGFPYFGKSKLEGGE